MCIRDSIDPQAWLADVLARMPALTVSRLLELLPWNWRDACLLYTSDAADERSSVDLGGRRIIKKKKQEYVSL